MLKTESIDDVLISYTQAYIFQEALKHLIEKYFPPSKSNEKIDSLEYYLGLPYDIHVERHQENDTDYFYSAYILELGKYTNYGVGKSLEQALKSLRDAQEVTITDILEMGKEVPLPMGYKESHSTGRNIYFHDIEEAWLGYDKIEIGASIDKLEDINEEEIAK